MKTISLVIAACLLGGCLDTGAVPTRIDLSVAGTDVNAGFVVDGDWTIALDTADIAFGPLYLCAGAQAGELCETARAQWLDSTVVDALDERSTSAGTMTALTGHLGSWMYDLGIASVLTQPEPLVLAAAAALDGHSVRVSGTATRGSDEIAFSVALAVEQQEGTEAGVPVIRKSVNDPFEHELGESQEQLTVRFDPKTWLTTVDFDQFCDPDCATDVVFSPDSQAWRAVRTQLLVGQRPEFSFGAN